MNGEIVNTKLDLNVKGCFKKPKKKTTANKQTNKQKKKLQNIKFREEKKKQERKTQHLPFGHVSGASWKRVIKFGKQSIRENLVRTDFPGRSK